LATYTKIEKDFLFRRSTFMGV